MKALILKTTLRVSMMSSDSHPLPHLRYPLPASAYLLLVISAALVFLGRAYQYLCWDAPLRAFFWDQALLEPFVTRWSGHSWQAYVTDLQVVENITRLQFAIGWLFLLAGLGALLLLRWNNKWLRGLLLAGTVFLGLNALLDAKEHFYHLIQLLEHSIQVGVPLLLILILRQPEQKKWWLLGAKVVVALTFTAHGMYALGVYPVPANFVDMTIRLLGVSEGTARTFLLTVGALDLVAAVFLFLPRLVWWGLGYCILWGTLTALARTVIGIGLLEPVALVHQQLYQTVFRLPHGLLPLLLWPLLRAENPGAAAGAKDDSGATI